MPLPMNSEQVLAMAPDASAAAAGRKLANPATWQGIGRSEQALWGQCQGSALYQTQIALSDLTTKCSCPSRKFPCKHALGLMLIAAAKGDGIAVASEPEWVAGWLQKRTAAADKREAKQSAPPKPVDEVAQGKRVAQRQDRVLKGIEQLETWLDDLVRQGLGRLESEPPSFWEQQAKRLVDAQAPGLASAVRRLSELPHSAGDWSAEMFDRLGLMALATHAYKRLEALDPAVQRDVRQFIGFNVEQAVVIAEGESVADDWAVVAQSLLNDERVRVQRSWLCGHQTGRVALVLQFAAGPERFPEVVAPGTAFRAELSFWPSAFPMRALIVKREGQASVLSSITGATSVETMLAEQAQALAKQPWLEAWPALLNGVVPVMRGERLYVRDAQGAALPLAPGPHDRLLALSGGHPVDVAGEWDGYRLRPLTAAVDGRFVMLRSAHA